MGLTVASHNIMHGVFLERLTQRYQSLLERTRVDILCLQENVSVAESVSPSPHSTRTHADLIAEALGEYRAIWLAEHVGLATLVHSRFEVQDRFLVRLPRLQQLSWFERLYIKGGKVKQKYALVTVLGNDATPVTIVNFHLDTAGNNHHRTAQVQSIADALESRGIRGRVVVCGDTNAFAWSRKNGQRVVRHVMAPLEASLRATPHGDFTATHYFARQREALLTHRVVTLLGKLGIDHPLPYDVMCSDITPLNCSSINTQESDHDLVLADFPWPVPESGEC